MNIKVGDRVRDKRGRTGGVTGYYHSMLVVEWDAGGREGCTAGQLYPIGDVVWEQVQRRLKKEPYPKGRRR